MKTAAMRAAADIEPPERIAQMTDATWKKRKMEIEAMGSSSQPQAPSHAMKRSCSTATIEHAANEKLPLEAMKMQEELELEKLIK